MEEYWEWFCSIPGIYRPHREILLRCFKDPHELFRASAGELSHLQSRGCGWMQRVIDFRRQSDPAQICEAHRSAGAGFVSCMHPAFPSRLRQLRDFPYGLFYKGKLPEEKVLPVAIVGARKCTQHGRALAEMLSGAVIRAGGTVISGAAYGIDGAAQWAALEAGGTSYAVLGGGVDVCYPSSHARLFARLEREGGLLSEFPPGTKAMPTHFPMRNRIISGLSDAVVIVEARKKSGSLITADFALDQGRTVFAVPGRPDDELSRGCNELIAQGAGVVTSAEALTEALFPENGKNKKEESVFFSLAPAEKLVYSIVGLHGESLWELEEKTSLALSDLSDALLSLEGRGLIRETEQNFYVKVK